MVITGEERESGVFADPARDHYFSYYSDKKAISIF